LGYLIAAVAATAAGPFLYGLLHERPRLTRYVDLFVYLVVPLLVVWQIVPSAWEGRTVLPVLALGAGLAVPLWIGRLSKPLAESTDAVTLVLVLSGLLLHALFEGAGLAPLTARSPAAFGLAVVLHRVVEGLLVWWILRPARGVWAATAGVAAVMLMTTLGFLLGVELLGRGDVSGSAVTIYQALVAGSLLHVIFHQGRHAHTHAHIEPHVYTDAR
jgi:hypothetical protein